MALPVIPTDPILSPIFKFCPSFTKISFKCAKIEISPIPPLIALAIFSNTGGVATLVGDPPNVLIASYASARDLGFGFMSFIYHLTPLAIIAWGATLWYMHRHFKNWREVKSYDAMDPKGKDGR